MEFSILDFLISLDHALFKFLNVDIANSYFDSMFIFVTDMHKFPYFKYLIPVFILSTLVYLRKTAGMWMFLGLVISLGISDFLGGRTKHLFMRERPFTILNEAIQRSGAGGFSFPSNHSINMFCAALFLTFFFPKGKYFFLLIATLVAFSRIYNGVHFPSDVFCGAIFGGVVGYVGAFVTQKVIDHSKLGKKANV